LPSKYNVPGFNPQFLKKKKKEEEEEEERQMKGKARITLNII
jgi:hypothetical protein